MSLRICVLASGSGGNATLVLAGEGADRRTLLIDCGIGMRTVAQRIEPLGAAFDDITDIVVTHFDQDHFRPWWVNRIHRCGIRVHLHRGHRGRALRAGLDGRSIRLIDEPCTVTDGVTIEPVLLAHDAEGTLGFVLESGGCRLGWATDLGRVPPAMLDRFVGLHALGIESNYDPDLERNSGRPAELKRRIMGGRGHLSNEESLAAVRVIDEQSPLAHIVLLHLSRQCNDPRLVARAWAQAAPHLVDRVTITRQDGPTALLDLATGGLEQPSGPGGQLRMFV